MDPSRDMSQNGAPENPCLSTENDIERYFDFDSYYGSSKSPSDRHSLSSPRANRSTSPDSYLDYKFHHQDFSSPTEYYSSTWDQDFDYPVHEMSRYSTSDDGASVSGYSGHSPPELVRGGSTSPSEHSSPYYSDRPDSPPQVAALREAQIHDDEWIPHPRQDSHSPKSPSHGYPHEHHAAREHHRSKRTEDQSASLKRRRSGDTLEKRHRHLVDPSQTADVRRSGACIPCRVSKTRCHENGVCPTCRQAFPEHSTLACLRFSPSGVYPMASRIPDIWSKHAHEEADFLSHPRFFIGNPKRISIFFSKEATSPPLPAIVQAYQSHKDDDSASLRTASFPNERMPLHPELQTWAEGQMQAEHKPDFEHALQCFLWAYSAEGYGLPKHNLVTKVHKLNCFFKIWKSSRFFCRDPSNNFVSLPTSTQAQLREIARKAVYSYEMDVLKELDDCLTQQSSPKPEERLAIWASMWQLIFIYRECLSTFRKYMERVQPASEEEYKYNKKIFQKLSDVVFPMIAVFYHYQFRTKKSIEVSLDWLKGKKYPRQGVESRAIHGYGQLMIETRKDMLHKLQASKSRTDARLCVFVVNHELKKLNARKRKPKTSSKSRGSLSDDECDDE